MKRIQNTVYLIILNVFRQIFIWVMFYHLQFFLEIIVKETHFFHQLKFISHYASLHYYVIYISVCSFDFSLICSCELN